MISANATYRRLRATATHGTLALQLRERSEMVQQALLIPGFNPPNPNDLFRNGQPGGWADPYDLTRMWQDDAGTTPMTLANLGTGVGRCITKGNAITLTQANAADRPVWGRHPVSGIRNLLLNTAFTGTVPGSPGTRPTSWNEGATTGSIASYDVAAGEIGFSATSARRFIEQTITVPINSTYTFSTEISVTVPSTILSFFCNSNDPVSGATRAFRLNGATAALGDTVPVGTHTIELIITTTSTEWTSGYRIGVGCRTGDVTGAAIFRRPQAEVGSARSIFQAVTNRFDITEVGSPSLYYFDGNGVNQFMQSSANVNLSGTAKATIWSWVHKRSDAANLVLLEQTIGTPYDSFIMVNRTGTRYGADIRDTSNLSINANLSPAPSTDSIVSVFDLTQSTEVNKIRIWQNGTLSDNFASNSGPITRTTLLDRGLQMFRRSNGTLFFNGRCYGWILAGDTYDTRTIQRFDAWGLRPRRLITA